MDLLAKLLRKKSHRSGVVSLCFFAQGLTIAISRYTTENSLQLEFSEFVSDTSAEVQEKFLRQLVEKYQLTEFECYLLLESDDYRHLTIEAPVVEDSEMKEALRWKMTDLVDFSVEEACLDFYNLPVAKHANSKKMVSVVACSMAVIKQKIALCEQVGLKLRVIDIQEMALRNLAVLLPENSRGVAILHLLPQSGSIVIQKAGNLYLSRKLNMGFDNLTLDTNAPSNESNDLALEIQRSLDYVESYYGLPPISSLAVIPTPTYCQNLLDQLNESLGITARIMDISTILESDNLLTDKTQAYCASVIGASLRLEHEAI